MPACPASFFAVIPAKAGIQRFFSSANPPGRGKVTGFRVKPGMTKVRKDSRLGESPGVIGQAGMTENGNLLRNGGTVPSPLGNNLKISPNPCLSDRQASFLKRGTGTPPPLEKGDGGGFSDKMTLIAAATTGLLFGLHPLHVESVAWVSERKDLLCAVFFLLSILSYLKYSETEAFIQTNESNPLPCPPFLKGGKGGLWKSYLLSLVFFILALLSKPMAVTLPLVLLILDWYPLRRINSLKTFKTAFVEKLPFIALSIASSIATVLAQRAGGALETMEVTPLYTRMLVATKSLMAYLWKMVVPLDLNPFYPYPKEASLFSLEYIASIVLVVGITAMCIAAAGKRRLWLSVWGYYVIMLLPVLGIVQVGLQSMADRYMYLPSLGPFLLIGLAGARGWELIERQGKRRSAARILIVSSAVFVIVLLSYATFKQIGIWRSSIVFWSYVVEKEPERIPVAYYNRAIAFDKAGAPARAIADYDKAIALKPSDYKAFNNRGLVFEKMGLLDRAIMDYN